MYKCVLCGKEFEDIDNADIIMGMKRSSVLIKLDGVVHDLRLIRKRKKQEALVHDPIPQEPLSDSQKETVSSEINPQPDNHPDRGVDALRTLSQEQEDTWDDGDSPIKF